MAVTDTRSSDFSMGRIVRNTFGVIGRNPVTMFILALLTGVPLFLIAFLTYSSVLEAGPEMVPSASSLMTGAVAVIVYLLTALIVQAAVIHVAVRDLNGQTARLGESVAIGMRHALPIILMAIVAYLGIAVGLVLLIIPGIILSLMWSMIIPVRVIENKTVFDCLSRSRELTAFYRWHILGLFIAYAIMAFILSLVITPFELQVMAAAASGSLSTVVLVVYFGLNAFITMVQSVIGSAGIAATYFELRAVKEGIGPEALAAVFD